MSTEVEATTPGSEDEYHLDLLGTFHWILAGLVAVAGLFPIFHVLFGFIAIVASLVGEAVEPEARGLGVLMGFLFMAIGSAIMVTFWVIAYCLYLSGSYLKAHKNHTFCMVMAVIICFSFPLGTALGVFTILVLIRPSVRQLFGVA
ncbi:hypothetical protein Pan97_11180 [Bremerella volcania]|uniref:Yip1 domain-containing protein n=1 Tax=Bremerella volcania TaxID=2527984 RepID=A0A518C4G0_9BACT|nr:hypothetical protein [Bremerella volcania]QDU74113.1 hypothetical protein Pan97_11180 [Bremerella volcania]